MAELKRLKEWKGNIDWQSGFHRGYQEHRHVWMKKLNITKHTDPLKYSSSYIKGFEAGVKQHRLEKLLTNG